MKFAGRLALGNEYAKILSKHGMTHTHADGTQVLACGLACSEIFHGTTLARVLRPSHELEHQSLVKLEQGQPAPTLALHTSAGVSDALSPFMEKLQPHLPSGFQTDDTCLSLQVSGADAVWAGVDLCLQLQHARGHTQRCKVAVASQSYHGPGTSAFGSAMPLGPYSKTPLQVTYPAPSLFNRLWSETHTDTFHDRMWLEYEEFLDSPVGKQTGVLLIEPQSGSSKVAQPWNRHLLQRYVQAAQARGILVLADEIMCGLGRHGQGTTFCSDAWSLNVDALTFGKAIGGGVEPLAGAVLKLGAEELGNAGKSVIQGHTYAGASARALTTGGAVLDELSTGGWVERVEEVGARVLQPLFEEISLASKGLLGVHGQGFMWGGAFAHSDPEARRLAVDIFRKEATHVHVMPYLVPEAGGFMFTPMMDVLETDLIEAGERLVVAVERTAKTLRDTHQWKVVDQDDPFMGCSIGSRGGVGHGETKTKHARYHARYKGPQDHPAAMTARQQEIYDAIAQNRSTGVAGPFGPWLANPELAQHAQMLGKTCRYDLKSYDLRHSELVILMVAMHTNAPTEWAIHVVEARRAGLEENIIEALQMYGAHMPTDVKNVVYGESQQDRAIADFASELLLHNRVTDATYEGLHECVGDVGCVELVGLVGYYGLVSLTLNAFEIEP